MKPTREPTRRINVSFAEPVLELLERIVPPRERNRFIVEATEQALRRQRLRAMIASLRREPAWSAKDHPDLMTIEDVDRYVRQQRESWMPHTWDEMIAGADPNA